MTFYEKNNIYSSSYVGALLSICSPSLQLYAKCKIAVAHETYIKKLPCGVLRYRLYFKEDSKC